MIKINLLPVQEKEKEENVRRQISFGMLVLLLAVVVMGLLWFQQYAKIASLEKIKGERAEQLAQLKAEVGDLSKLEGRKKELEKRRDTIANLSKHRLLPVKVLDRISESKPDALYFTKIEQQNAGEPWQNFSLTLEGVAVDNEIIAQYMRELQKIDLLRNVDLDYTKAKSMSNVGAFQEFRLRMEIPVSSDGAKQSQRTQGN
jgi:type IV pilus assembly protein PilN